MGEQRKISQEALAATISNYGSTQSAADAEFGARIAIESGNVSISEHSIAVTLKGKNVGQTTALSVQFRIDLISTPNPKVRPMFTEALMTSELAGDWVGNVLAKTDFEEMIAYFSMDEFESEVATSLVTFPQQISFIGICKWKTTFGVDHKFAVVLTPEEFTIATIGDTLEKQATADLQVRLIGSGIELERIGKREDQPPPHD